MHCFRLRLDMHGFHRFASDDQHHVLEANGPVRVSLEVVAEDPHFGDGAAAAVVTGAGYSTAEAAWDAGATWTAVLQRAFAIQNIGADTGARRLSEPWPTSSSKKDVTGTGPQVEDDVPGLTVYEQRENAGAPLFSRKCSSGWAGRSPTTLVEDVEQVLAHGAPLSPIALTAYELYSSSFSATSTELDSSCLWWRSRR